MTPSTSRSLLALALFASQVSTPALAGSSMKAIEYEQWGDARVLRYVDVPKPTAKAGEVLVRVEAAGVNSIDWENRNWGPLPKFAKTLPVIPGYDVAGEVVQIGAGVTGHALGEPVFAMLPLATPRAYAQFVAVSAELLVTQPRGVDAIHAAAVPLVGLTAWQALFEAGQLKSGQTVLIHGAAGGVGHLAVQLAKSAGARVIGTASAANLDFLRKLGVDQAIDYRARKFEDIVHDVDLVLDTVGGETLTRSYQVIRRGGRLVSIAGRIDPKAASARGIEGKSILVRPDAAQLGQIAALMQGGKVHAEIDTVYPLRDAARAMDKSEGRHVHGRLVLQVAEPVSVIAR